MLSGRRVAATLLALCTATTLSACTGGEQPTSTRTDASPSRASATPTASPTQERGPLTFGVYGNAEEMEAWQSAVDSYNDVFDAEVRLRSWPTWRQADAAMRAGDLPDVFMLNRRGLAGYLDEGLTQPVDELLDERGVNFGDDYSRDAMEEFSVGTSLSCMPLSLSPMVIYRNTELVDFQAMAEQGLPAPSSPDRWTFEEFAAAADFAARPRRAINGVYVEPSLLGLAPFIRSGGGNVFDDTTEPTSLDLSSEETNAALERVLEVLRDAQLTPSPLELADTTPREMFLDGDLGMIAGFRSLTPRLRARSDFEFDVMPMPVIDSGATVGDLDGLCLSAQTADAGAAADFLAFAMSESTVRAIARAGRTVPANVAVANSPDFLQDWDEPQNSAAFISSMRNVEPVPLLADWNQLEASVSPYLSELLSEPVLDLPTLTTEIDEISRTVLAPEGVESEAPSPSPSESSTDQ